MLHRRLILMLAMLFFFPLDANSQQNQNPVQGTEIGGGMTDRQFLEVENQLSEGLPQILEGLKDTATLVESQQWEQAKAKLDRTIQECAQEKKILQDPRFFDEIESYVDKSRNAIQRADAAIAKKNKPVATTQLKEAYRYVKAISASPVLKLAASEIALGQASRMIGQNDYQSANMFLQRAIDNITQVQQDPRLQGNPELNKIKNEIIITQQQVSLGKLKDEKRLHRFYPGLAAARTNTLNSYYSIWNRGDQPWDMY